MELIKEISPESVWVPFIIALFQLKTMSSEKRFLLGAVILGIIGEFSMVWAKEQWQNNMPVTHIYTIVEYCLLISVFHFGRKDLLRQKWYRILLITFVLLGILNVLFIQGIWVWNTIMRSLEAVILISISLLYFNHLLKSLDIPKPEKTFMFWFSISILVYFSGNLLLFIYFNYVTKIGIQSPDGRALADQIRLINYILNILLYLLYSIAFLCKEQKPFPKSSLSAP